MSTPFSTLEMTPFLGRENHSPNRLSPHCSQQSHLHHPWPPAAKGNHCQLKAQPAPEWEWIYVLRGVGHHRKKHLEGRGRKRTLTKQEQPQCQGQREPEGGHLTAGGFSLLPQTESFILEWHRGFSVLCLFQESLHGTTVAADTCVCPFGFEPFLPAREFLRK